MKFKCTQCGEERSAAFVSHHMAAHLRLARMPHTYVETFNEPEPYNPDNWDGWYDYRQYAAEMSSRPFCGTCGCDPSSKLHNQTIIEYPATGLNGPYRTDGVVQYGVYEYGYYESYSVLAGQQRRSFLNTYNTLEEAQTAHPEAIWNGGTSERVEPYIPDNPPAWFDESAIGESWDGE